MFLLTLGLAFCACPSIGQDRSEFHARFLQNMDGNSDGVLEPDEVPDRAKRYVDRLAERAGLDTSRPLAISRLLNPTEGKESDDQNRRGDENGGRGENGRGRWRSRSDERASSDTAAASDSGSFNNGVAGFGEPDELAKVPGFDVPIGTQPLEARFTAAVIREAESILGRYDRDGSDVLEPDEIRRGNWRNDPKSSDLNGDGKLSKEELCERVARYQAERDGKEYRPGGNSSKSISGSSASFGKSGNSSDGSSEKLRSYAESLLRQYDKNKNGVLEKDEWTQMRGDPAKSDQNSDGVITKDELVVRLSSYGRSSSSVSPSAGSSSASADSSSGGRTHRPYSSSRSRRDEQRPTPYRSTTPTARLPKGLPSWFARNDANEDGQIAMSEYSADWSDSKAAEFDLIDTNRDGVITPDECLAAEEANRK